MERAADRSDLPNSKFRSRMGTIRTCDAALRNEGGVVPMRPPDAVGAGELAAAVR